MPPREVTFLGAVEPLGSLPGEAVRSLSGEGHAVVGVDGTLWTTDATETIARTTGLPEGRVIRGAFADARRGAVILDGGQALATLDGGVRWAPVGPPDEAAWWLDVDRGDPMLTTTRGELRLDASGGSSFEVSAPGAVHPRSAAPSTRTVDASVALPPAGRVPAGPPELPCPRPQRRSAGSRSRSISGA